MDPTLTITLIPTSRSRDPVGPRVLVLGPGDHTAVVGRSSKVESKNLVPAKDNGWFDNRVMSRAHAEFTAIPKFQEVYLMDTNSMHGSLVNDIKLTGGRKTLLESNDVLTFGATVSRGSDTFDPLEVRLELKWEDVKPEKSPAKLLPSINTFTVPDDDEFDNEDWTSEVEFVQENPISKNPVIEKDSAVVQIIDTDDEESDLAERDGSSVLAQVPDFLNDDDSVLSDNSDMEEGLDYTPSEKDDLPAKDTDGSIQEDAGSEVSSSDANSAVSPAPSSDKEQEQEQELSLPTSPQTHDAHTALMSSHESPFGTALYVDEHSQEKIQKAINAHKQAFENVNRPQEQVKEKMEKRTSMHKQAFENAGNFHDITKNHLEKADRVAQQLSHNLYSLNAGNHSDTGNSTAKPPKPMQTPDVNEDTAEKDSNDVTNATVTAPTGSSSVTVNEPTTSVQDPQTGHIPNAPSVPPKSNDWPTRPTLRPSHEGSLDPLLFGRRQMRIAEPASPPMSRSKYSASSPVYPSPYSPYNPLYNPLHESHYAQGPFAHPPRPSPIPTVSMSQVNAVHQHPPTPPSSVNFPAFVGPNTAGHGQLNRPDGINSLQCPPPAGGYSGRELSREDFATRDDWLSARLDNMLERMTSTQDANDDVVHAKSRPLSVSRSDPRTIVQEGGENRLKRKHGEIETSTVGKPVANQSLFTAPAEPKAAIEAVRKHTQSTNDSCVQEPPTQVAQVTTHRAEGSEERPPKRTKSSHTSGTLTRYATTALAGVVVGGVGAVMALAALPAGFFE